MKQHSKKIQILVFVFILIVEFYVYFSEYDLTIYLTIPIFVATPFLILFLFNNNFQNKKLKVIFSSLIILFTILFFLWEVILASLKSANEISQTWNINKYEIQSVTRTFDGLEPSFYTLKRVYFSE